MHFPHYVFILLLLAKEICCLRIDYRTIDHCSLPCVKNSERTNETNILCDFKTRAPDTSCAKKGFVLVKMTTELRMEIMRSHNGLRNRVAMDRNIGPVANMHYLDWNYELEAMALAKIKICDEKIDRRFCGTAMSVRVPGSTNVLDKTVKSLIFPRLGFVRNVIRLWYLQGTWATRELLKSFHEDSNATDFTQIIWAETEELGCAASRYLKGQRSYRMVCVYSPAGNVVGSRVFIRGMNCAHCDDDVICNKIYKGLCGDADTLPGGSQSVGPCVGTLSAMLGVLVVHYNVAQYKVK